MNKYAVFMLALSLSLSAGTGIARAEDTAAGAAVTTEASATVKPLRVEARAELKAKVDAKAEARKETLEAKKASTTAAIKAKVEERRAKLEAAKKARVEAAARKTIVLLNNALETVRSLASRTEVRISKIEAAGNVKLDAAKTKLAEAKASWDTAMAKVVTLDADLKVALESETPVAAFETFKTNAAAARDEIRAAHAKVVEAITLIKASLPKVEASATTTTSVSTEAATQ